MISQPTASLPTNKPVELYIFIDPLCSNSFAMQSMLRKLQLEYEHYFSWRYVLSTELTSLNCLSNRIKGCLSGDELDITHPALPSIAIKAAELQGKRAARAICQNYRSTLHYNQKMFCHMQHLQKLHLKCN